MDAWKQYQQTANRITACESKNGYSSSEQLSVEALNSNQIATKGEKLEGNA
ncbi:MAG: hypothetical protein AAFR37_01985 [Cyanobacteria bacterium J06628_3]